VAERDILRRIDAHIERGNEIMERNTEAFERHSEAFERHGEAFDRHMAALRRLDSTIGDQRRFTQELLLRFDKALLRIDRTLLRLDQNAERRALGFERRARAFERHVDEVIAEQRAQRGALLAVLDRLGPPGPSTAT
jgi:hypothetical protein